MTLRLRLLVHWACVEALFLAGLGSVMGSVQATSLAFGSSLGRCALFARSNEELVGCAEALASGFLDSRQMSSGHCPCSAMLSLNRERVATTRSSQCVVVQLLRWD